MKRLVLERVVDLHDALVARHGGQPGLRDRGLLEAALARPFASFSDVEAFPTPEAKAAALMHGIITSHPFVDGNKRTGAACALIALRSAGLALDLDIDRLEELTVRVASGLSVEELAQTFRDHLRER